MFGRRALDQLAEGVIHQLAAILRVSPEGLVCAQQEKLRSPLILAGTGRLAGARGQPLSELPHPQVAAFISRCLAERRTLLSRDGICLYLETPSRKRVCVFAATEPDRVPTTDQQLLAVLGRNISLAFDNAEMFEEIQRRAYFDPETGLPNLASYEFAVSRRLANPAPFVVIILDIVRFRTIQHGIGADLARTVVTRLAALLRATLPEAIFIGRRTGADEFILVVDGGETQARQAFTSVRLALAAPLNCDGLRTPIRVCGGYAMAPRDGSKPDLLLQSAGVALADVTSGRQTPTLTSYQPEMLRAALDRLSLTVTLQEALHTNRTALHFQPIFPVGGGRPVAAEALLRVRSSDGFYPALRMIDAAEHSGMIAELGVWVLRQALAWQAGLARAGHRLAVAVNLSPTQLNYDDIRDLLERTLALTGAEPADVILEMTEQMFLDPEDSAAVEVFAWFRSIGGRVAIDDFGTGYSSLRYLHRLPVDIVKIDRTFIAPLDPAATSAALSPADRDRPRRILDSMVGLAKSLNLRITAEGVETARQLDEMRTLGVDTVQGFHLGRPIPPDEFRTWLGGLPC